MGNSGEMSPKTAVILSFKVGSSSPMELPSAIIEVRLNHMTLESTSLEAPKIRGKSNARPCSMHRAGQMEVIVYDVE